MTTISIHFTIAYLLTGFLLIGLSFFVFLQDIKNQLNKNFAFYSFSIGFWCLISSLLTSTDSYAIALLSDKICFIGVILIPLTFFNFITTYLDRKDKRKYIKKTLIFFTILFLIIDIFNINFIAGLSPRKGLKYFTDPGFFYYVYVIYFSIICAYCIFLIFQSLISKNCKKNDKKQLLYFLIASVIGYGGGILNYSLTFKLIPTEIAIVGHYTIAIYTLIIAFLIFRHDFLKINLILKKTLVYSTLISSFTIVYFLFIYLIEMLFREVVGLRSVPMTLITFTTFAILFIPFKNKIQMFFDKHFFHGSIEQIDAENIRLREELHKSERLKAVATLAAGMAHEIKNPLTSIKTFTEFIDKKKDDPDFINKFKEIVGPEVDRINHIVKQLLEFSKPSELELKDTNINNLLNETLELLNNQFISRNIKIEKHLNDLPTIKTDPNQIKQVFLNLLLNAIEAINTNGTITVSTKAINSSTTYDIPHTTYEPVVNISISDTGCGINKADIPRLFDPFYTNKDSGTGLGLSVVHGIIDKHHGKIEVNSEINKGTEFRISL